MTTLTKLVWTAASSVAAIASFWNRVLFNTHVNDRVGDVSDLCGLASPITLHFCRSFSIIWPGCGRSVRSHPMRPIAPFALALAIFFGGFLPSSPAFAEGSVTWSQIDVPPGEGSEKLQKNLKKLLDQAARKANFGKAKKLVFSLKMTDFVAEQKGDVYRVSCTMVGRVPGGPSAKSRISFGGSPADKVKLEKQVLTMVANAVVTRLAEIVRSRAAKEAEKVEESD